MYISEVNAKKCIEKQVNYLVRSLMRRIFVLGPMQKRKKRKISNAWSINLSSYSTWFQIRFGKNELEGVVTYSTMQRKGRLLQFTIRQYKKFHWHIVRK